jgi:hypothetical protein
MTALVVVEAPEHGRNLTVTDDDVDREKHSSSRLRVGATLSRDDMLHIALMSSENRAASALGRNYPGGLPAFVAAMNAKARSLGMTDTRYVDSTGLSSQNVASARDLAKLVVAAYNYPIIRQYSTDPKHGRAQRPRHAVQQLQPPDLQQGVGYRSAEDRLHQRGRPLPGDVHRIEGRPIVMVFLDSKGRLSHVGDAARMRKWLVEDQPNNLTRVKMVRAKRLIFFTSIHLINEKRTPVRFMPASLPALRCEVSVTILPIPQRRRNLAGRADQVIHPLILQAVGRGRDRQAGHQLAAVVADAGGHAAHAQFQFLVVAHTPAHAPWTVRAPAWSDR